MRTGWNKWKIIDPVERFWKYVKKTDVCWEWVGAKRTNGYGTLQVNGKSVLAHRFSYAFHKGKIPSGLFVLHTCDNKPCVNPRHLWIGSAQDNMTDKMKKGRYKGGFKEGFDARRNLFKKGYDERRLRHRILGQDVVSKI